ncbi:hypothetical protein C8R46DRAFT_1305146 [Mycena filopes]|nr:hypothetical protein C8R46DRAFT_1305146 [Mycena filopes]
MPSYHQQPTRKFHICTTTKISRPGKWTTIKLKTSTVEADGITVISRSVLVVHIPNSKVARALDNSSETHSYKVLPDAGRWFLASLSRILGLPLGPRSLEGILVCRRNKTGLQTPESAKNWGSNERQKSRLCLTPSGQGGPVPTGGPTVTIRAGALLSAARNTETITEPSSIVLGFCMDPPANAYERCCEEKLAASAPPSRAQIFPLNLTATRLQSSVLLYIASSA